MPLVTAVKTQKGKITYVCQKVFSTPITKRWNLVYSLDSFHFEEWSILVWYNNRYMHLKTNNKAVVSWDASYQLIELVSRKKQIFPWGSCSISLSFCVNSAFVIKVKEEHLCYAQEPNQSHLTPFYFCELSCAWVRIVCLCRVCACGCEERVSVAESMQQIAVGLNKLCTVAPCGSTDSFYSSHKE